MQPVLFDTSIYITALRRGDDAALGLRRIAGGGARSDALARQEDDPQREEAELLHGATGYAPPPTMGPWPPTGSSRCFAPPFPRRRS